MTSKRISQDDEVFGSPPPAQSPTVGEKDANHFHVQSHSLTASRASSLGLEDRGSTENGNLLLPERSPLRSSLIKEGSRKPPSPGGATKSVSFGTMPTEKKVSNGKFSGFSTHSSSAANPNFSSSSESIWKITPNWLLNLL